MQPLARASDENENIVEQFQLVLNGWEVLKSYSELVDPKLQKQKFDEQSGAIEM
jgi:lysyl-tRNA synthetase class 2